MSERHIRVQQDSHEERVSVTKKAVAAAGVAAVVLAGGLLAEKLSGSEADRSRQEAAKVQVAESVSLVLEDGVHLRSSPEVVSGAGDGVSNVKLSVPSGKQLFVRYPVESPDHHGWLGFHNPEDKKDPTADSLVWVNAAELDKQHKVHFVLEGKGESYAVSLKNGEFVADGNGHLPIAHAELGSAGTFDDEIRYGQ